ncbi:hypothetical protein ACFQ49_02115 [Kroppenstedtia eburnea]|uniref:Membrane protein YqaA, SNARE-associated domain n=1 Tax=Kroppenstedtia eburnea TaxID=714067 RepID=A0A1N7KS54_9BACL|nr:hypothetical protein [Kroppenstedtia eburnea]QKI82839.1 hypothetical protein GXN75_13010 [Kroppenstedtia eburnea]SIS64336.1 hypothetical protein SAMN05421790_103236 [Kroppenstedtia eburnea]
MGMMLFAMFWGFAEATLFFIVPDVLLTAIAVKSLHRAMRASLWALAGALLGGSLMFLWGAVDGPQAAATVTQVPAINTALVEQVRENLAQNGLISILLGPTRGIPYKIFAIQSQELGIGFLPFLLISIPARIIRFVGASLLAGWISHSLLKTWSLKAKYVLWMGAWLLFYGFYFSVYPW